MAPPISKRWTTRPEYIALLNYVIERTKDAKSPMNITPLAKEFKEKRGAVQTVSCLMARIEALRTHICSFEHIDTNTKVKLMFALSASVNADFLKKLKEDAFVKVDGENRITHYKTSDGSLKLAGEHSRSAKMTAGKLVSKRSLRSLITNYFETKDDADAVPTNEKEGEMWNFIEFITEKCHKVNSPLSITRLTEEFVEKFRTSMTSETAQIRIRGYRLEIQRMEFVDTRSKVQQLFCLSATLNSDCLEKLRKNALVEVDEKNRIVHYKSNDGSIELRGDHSQSAKTKTAMLESKRSFRSLVNSCFEKKNNSDAVPENDKEKDMWNLIGFIIEKCENSNCPLNITQLTKDFNNQFRIAWSFDCINKRIKKYCHEIQKAEFLDTPSKVKQLFSLGATVNSDCLEKIRKDAVVEVDNMNRITKYTANDGRLTLHGDHSRYAKRTLSWIMRRTNKNTVKKQCTFSGDENDESEKANGYSGEDSDEYSSEEFGSEFDSNDENDHLNETEDFTKPSNEGVDFDNDTPANNRSPTNMAVDNNFDFDLPTERTPRLEETELRDDEKKDDDSEITANASVKTRYGRLSKRRNLDSEFSYSLANSSTSATPRRTNSSSSKSAKQIKIAIEKEQASSSSNQSRSSSRPIRRSIGSSPSPSFSTESAERMRNQDAPDADVNPSDYHGPRIQTMDEYEYNPRDDNFESHPIDNQLEEPKPQATEEHNKNNEVQNNDLDKTQDPMEPSNEAYDSDNETSFRSREHSRISTDNNFDFDPPTERSHAPEETEIRKDDENDPEITENAAVKTQRFETLPKNKTSSSTSHTPKTRKRKADASDGSSTSKRTKPLPEKSMNPREINGNSSHDDPPRIELKPFRGLLGLPMETQKDSDIQQIPKPRSQVEEAPIKKECEEEAHTSLKMILNAFKSLILSLDTPGLSQLRMELDTKIMEAGRRIEISNKEVILAMELLIVKLANYGASKSSEDSICRAPSYAVDTTIVIHKYSTHKSMEPGRIY